jgi:hypothetical protein
MESIQWTENHTYLQAVMRKELETMQKLLSNISLEEQFILQKETRYWNTLMEERSQLKEELSKIHRDRLAIIEKIEFLACQIGVELEALLPPQDLNSWEILSLRDQMLTLADRISLQSSRNEMLLHVVKAPLPQQKVRTALETLSSEDYKDRDAS